MEHSRIWGTSLRKTTFYGIVGWASFLAYEDHSDIACHQLTHQQPVMVVSLSYWMLLITAKRRQRKCPWSSSQGVITRRKASKAWNWSCFYYGEMGTNRGPKAGCSVDVGRDFLLYNDKSLSVSAVSISTPKSRWVLKNIDGMSGWMDGWRLYFFSCPKWSKYGKSVVGIAIPVAGEWVVLMVVGRREIIWFMVAKPQHESNCQWHKTRFICVWEHEEAKPWKICKVSYYITCQRKPIDNKYQKISMCALV